MAPDPMCLVGACASSSPPPRSLTQLDVWRPRGRSIVSTSSVWGVDFSSDNLMDVDFKEFLNSQKTIAGRPFHHAINGFLS
jgi:hypothetical protein